MVWLATSRENIRLMAARSIPGRSTVPVSRLVSESRSAATRCAWVKSLADQPAAPQRQPSGRLRIRGGGGSYPFDDVRLVALVGQHLVYEVAGVRVDERRHLAIEVGGEAVADVRLDQPFQPVLRLGVVVERVEGGVERTHRGHHVDLEASEEVTDAFEVVHLARRESRHLHPVGQ